MKKIWFLMYDKSIILTEIFLLVSISIKLCFRLFWPWWILIFIHFDYSIFQYNYSIWYFSFYWISFSSFGTWLFSSRVKFVDLNKVSLYLSAEYLILYDEFVSCVASVIMFNLYAQFVVSPSLQTLLISDFIKKTS